MFDDIDKTQIGRYGTISLLKRQDPPTVVTSFGIDTKELTFGRDRDCSIRLYYADIDSIHCKIVFEDRKAFIIVLGKNGLLVDGCLVYPNPAVHGPQTTIPLTNNSEIEIHNKRFRFTYPPKELRAILFASPIRPNRAPRLSMIHSAQVFSPKLSKNLEENLRLLQSPLKSAFLSSPLDISNHISSGNQDRSSRKPTYDQSSEHYWIPDDEEGCEEIVLVEGDNPRVVEEEKDLVIIEDVEVPSPSSLGSVFSLGPHNEHHLHPSIVNPLQTPHRCQNSRDSLHRAVLIRSAQRAVLSAEKEEDELEEMEVLSVVASDDDEIELADETKSNGSMGVWNEKPISGEALKSMPRSTKRAQPSQDLSTVVESAEQDPLSPLKLCEDFQWKQDDIAGGQNEGSQNLASTNSTNLPNESFDKYKYLGDFRTPQPQSKRLFQKPLGQSLTGFKKASSGDACGVLDNPTSNSPRRARCSTASGEPRRMLIEMPWRVEDLIVPAKSEEHPVVNPGDIRHDVHSTESNSQLSTVHSVTPSSARRVDERERKAIRERRRSALRERDSFFAGGIPGMGSTPTKSTALLYRQEGLYDTPKKAVVPSLEENMRTLPSRKASDKPIVKSEEDEELDTQTLLERMKVTVEEMRRRRSTVFTPLSSSVQHREPPLSNNPAPATETRGPDVRMQVETSEGQRPMDRAEESGEQQPFSLLRLPKVVIEPLQDENENRSVEKSFSQLMRSESPEDLEQPSEDIRYILEQDITIPSKNLINMEHQACDITESTSYTVRYRTRSRTASAEPETNMLAREHGTAHNAVHTKQFDMIASGRPVLGPVRDRAPAPSIVQLRGRNCRKPGQKTINESQMSSSGSEEQEVPNTEINTSEDEDKRESTPTPAPRTMRISRRGAGVASVTNSRQLQDKAEDLEQVPSNTSNRRLKKSTAVDSNSDVKRKSRKAKKEDQGTSEIEGTRKPRTRSATVNGGTSRTTNASKTPATRSRKTPVTAPSAIPINCEDEKPKGDENGRNSKVTPAAGTRVRISKNKATSNSATTSRVKVEGVSAQRVTRTRART